MEPRHKRTILKALRIMEEVSAPDYHATGEQFTSPSLSSAYFKLRLCHLPREEFHVAFLTSQHRLIACEAMSVGTIDEASVYPREIAKRALELNAAAVVFAHNHPSGDTEPSRADIRITERLVQALDLFKVRVLDHIIVGHITQDCCSMSNRGLVNP